jgi:HlyD family secretion protein
MRLLTKLRLLKTKKFWIFFIIFLIVGGAIYFFTTRNSKAEEIQTTQVKRQDIKSTVSASGVLNGKESVNLKFKVGGKLAYLEVSEGDEVSQGERIAGLDTQDLAIRLRQAELNFIAKDATAKRVEDEVKGHDADENFEQKEDRVNAQTARDSAFDSQNEARRAFQDATLYSPIAGTITHVTVVEGQNISSADGIVQIVDFSEMYFDAEVDEADIAKVSLGQNAEVTLNSYEDRIFTGVIEEISKFTKTVSSGATVIVVRIKLDTPGVNLIQNLNGQASIISQQVSNVLSIPQEALKDEDTVVIKEGDKYKEVTVKTGLESDIDIQITEGLQEGQEVVTNPGAVKIN